MRLMSYIKSYCGCTKSELNKMQEQGLILVNGEKKNLTYIIKEGDVVTVCNKVIKEVPNQYFIYNKPIGVVCTNDLNVKNNIISHLNLKDRLFCVGRLDKDSHGLLILTNDGVFSNKLINGKNHIEKEYLVKVKDKITDDFIVNMSKSVVLRGKTTKECVVNKIDDYTFSIVLTEGMYRQIRRMVKINGNFVIDLYRFRIGNILINDLKEDEIRLINIDDIKIVSEL